MKRTVIPLQITLLFNIFLMCQAFAFSKSDADDQYLEAIKLMESYPARAELLATAANTTFLNTDNLPMAAKSTFLLGYLAEQDNRLLTAMLRYLEAVHYFESSGTNPTEHVSTLKNLGRIYRIAGRSHEAVTNYRRALALNTDPDEATGLVYNIGYAYYAVHRYDSAVHYFQQSYQLAMARTDWNRVSNSLNYMGLSHLYAGNAATAREYFHKILQAEPYLKDRYPRKAAQSWHNLALTELSAADTAAAIHSFEKALGIKRQLGDSASLFNTLLDLGELHQQLGHADTAIALLTEAEACYPAVVPDPERFKVYRLLEKAWAGTNPTRRNHYSDLSHQAWNTHWELHARLSTENLSYEVERIESLFYASIREREHRRQLLTLLWVGIPVIIVGGLLLFLWWKRRQNSRIRRNLMEFQQVIKGS